MSLDVYVTTTRDSETKKIVLEGEGKLIPTLGEGSALAVKIDDVLNALTSIIGNSIMNEAELVVEVTGSTSLKSEGKINYLFLNIGGSVAKDNLMKITLKTKIEPKNK